MTDRFNSTNLNGKHYLDPAPVELKVAKRLQYSRQINTTMSRMLGINEAIWSAMSIRLWVGWKPME